MTLGMIQVIAMVALVTPTFAQESRQLIYGGEQTALGKYPYYTEVKPDRFNVCGGTLVAPDMVLSHPQCLPLETEVKVGWYNRNDEESMDILNIPENDALFVHPLYDDSTFEYGFLLIKLDGNSGREIAHLNDNENIPTNDTPLSVVGRGSARSGGVGSLQNRLHEASLPFMDKETCELTRSTGGWNYKDLIGDSLFCAGSDDFSACEDDWGGPLVFASNGSPDVVVGVTSWTFGCGDTPSVFSRVSAGYDWLSHTICENSQSPPSYLGCKVADPQFSPASGPPLPPQPIKFKWTFTPDDFHFENAYTLERIEGFDVRKVDLMVPGAIPYGFGSTYERETDLQEGALYVWTIADSNSDGLGLDSGGAELFLEKDDGTFQQIHQEDETFSGGISHMFYATLDRDSIESPYYGANKFSNTSAFLKMTIEFDAFPWEFGWQLTTEDGDVVIYRPPRYYFNQVERTVSEDFTVPLGNTRYNLTVVDTYGDGLQSSRTFYRITDPQDKILVESQFRSGSSETKTFTYGAKGGGSAAKVWTLAASTFGTMIGVLVCL